MGSGIDFKGEKYLITLDSGSLKYIKTFGSLDKYKLDNCARIGTTKASVCSDQYSMFRFNSETKMFVYSDSAGITGELSSLSQDKSEGKWFPYFTMGKCDKI